MLRLKRSLKQYIKISSNIPGPKEVATAEAPDPLRIISKETINLERRRIINQGSKKIISRESLERIMRETMIKSHTTKIKIKKKGLRPPRKHMISREKKDNQSRKRKSSQRN